MSEDTTKPATTSDTTGTKPVYPKPHKGQDDSGHIVSGAADEPMSGTLADITDGDRRRTHKHK